MRIEETNLNISSRFAFFSSPSTYYSWNGPQFKVSPFELKIHRMERTGSRNPFQEVQDEAS